MKRSQRGTFQRSRVQKSLKTTVATMPRARGNFVYGLVRRNIPQLLCGHERLLEAL